MGKLSLDVLESFLLNFLACLDELDGAHRTELVAEKIAHRRLKHIVHQVLHGSHHGDDFGRLGVRHMDEHLQINLENEPFVALGDDWLEVLVQTVCAGDLGGPIQLENRRRDNFRLVDARIDGVFAGAQAGLPTGRDGRVSPANRI